MELVAHKKSKVILSRLRSSAQLRKRLRGYCKKLNRPPLLVSGPHYCAVVRCASRMLGCVSVKWWAVRISVVSQLAAMGCRKKMCVALLFHVRTGRIVLPWA